jgi:hypothetical protein
MILVQTWDILAVFFVLFSWSSTDFLTVNIGVNIASYCQLLLLCFEIINKSSYCQTKTRLTTKHEFQLWLMTFSWMMPNSITTSFTGMSVLWIFNLTKFFYSCYKQGRSSICLLLDTTEMGITQEVVNLSKDAYRFDYLTYHFICCYSHELIITIIIITVMDMDYI